jgi:hypothetical protein
VVKSNGQHGASRYLKAFLIAAASASRTATWLCATAKSTRQFHERQREYKEGAHRKSKAFNLHDQLPGWSQPTVRSPTGSLLPRWR